jgi:hypothetical protein
LLVAGLFWEKKYYWLVADKPNEQKNPTSPREVADYDSDWHLQPLRDGWCSPAFVQQGM